MPLYSGHFFPSKHMKNLTSKTDQVLRKVCDLFKAELLHSREKNILPAFLVLASVFVSSQPERIKEIMLAF